MSTSSVVFTAVALLVVIALTGSGALAAFCFNGGEPLGTPNALPFDSGLKPRFVKKTSSSTGALYEVGEPAHGNVVNLLHLYADNYYSFGHQMGELLGAKVNATVATAYSRLCDKAAKQMEKKDPKIPRALADLIAELGFNLLLDQLWEKDAPFIDAEIKALLRGLADASGTSLALLRRLAVFGELIKAGCSLVVAEPPATIPGGGRTMLRALDWETDVGLQDEPVMTVFHPTGALAAASNEWLLMSWAGYVGALQAVSRTRTTKQLVSMGEIGISNPNATIFGPMKDYGEPFIFTLTRTMRAAQSIEDIELLLKAANRTCDLFFGAEISTPATSAAATSPTEKAKFLASSSGSRITFYENSAENQPDESWHPPHAGVNYLCMDFLCPAFNRKMSDRLGMYAGALAPEVFARNITSVVKTGNLHINTINLDTGLMLISNARKDRDAIFDPRKYAYERTFIHVSVHALFDHVLS